MQKKLLVLMGLMLGTMSLNAQESAEHKRMKEVEKKLVEAKANQIQKVKEATKKTNEARQEALRSIESARSTFGSTYPGMDSLYWKGNAITGPEYFNLQSHLRGQLFPNEHYKEVSYAIPFTKGVLLLNFAPDTIESYDGNEIVLKSWVEKEEEAAIDGLVLVSGNGLADNTGLGLFVDRKGESDSVVIRELDMQGIRGVKVMVPEAVKIQLKYNGQYQTERIVFLNLKSELEVAVRFNPIIIKNITGAATVNSMYGSINALFDLPPSMPVSLISSYGNVDVTIPPISKVDLHVKTSWGKIYIAQSLVGKVQKDADSKESREQLKGKLNGGGTPFILSSGWGKIYLRLK